MENSKKNKVGIVTFHTADNYGAVLQCYALQKFLNDNGYFTQIIDFNTQQHENEHRLFRRRSPSLLKNLILQLIFIAHYNKLNARIVRFKDFRNKYFFLTSHRYTSEEDFLNNMEKFDFYITGSDQVFRPENQFSKCYYLNFPKNGAKKIAYAPSFGISDFSRSDKKKIQNLVSDFDFVSCREKNGASFLSELLDREVPVVCDPVFLLSKDKWLDISIKPHEHKSFIFVYDLNGGKSLIDIARKVSKENNNMRIICTTTNIFPFYNGVKVVRELGPLEFLGYISSAEYVVTDSFHGTILSLILGTRVITYPIFKAVSSRIYSIMSLLGIEDQIVERKEDFDFSMICFKDYSTKIKRFIAESINYINRSLS